MSKTVIFSSSGFSPGISEPNITEFTNSEFVIEWVLNAVLGRVWDRVVPRLTNPIVYLSLTDLHAETMNEMRKMASDIARKEVITDSDLPVMFSAFVDLIQFQKKMSDRIKQSGPDVMVWAIL